MLMNIKSIYFIKLLISHVNERQKLKLIKYNFNLQKSMNISLINYKHFTGKYIIYESNGIGKEYYVNVDSLIFEGEYIKGERNGKGKEYENCKLIFEGEYKYGEKNGKGKSYYSDGKLDFEGEFLNNKKLIGIQYDKNGNIIEKLNHKIGKGKEYDLENINTIGLSTQYQKI